MDNFDLFELVLLTHGPKATQPELMKIFEGAGKADENFDFMHSIYLWYVDVWRTHPENSRRSD